MPPATVPLYLRAADLLVIPNSAKDADSARFTSPMKLYEYMASGTPILASNVPSLREALTEETALFVTPDDAAALARGVSESLAHPDEALSRARKAQEAARSHTWQERARRILEGVE